MRCWSCGRDVTGWNYQCGFCRNSAEITALRNEVAGGSSAIETFLDAKFNDLSHSIASGLSEIAEVLKWGLEDIKWSIEEQTAVLRDIEMTLRTPIQTKANELREMGEEMRKRGVFDKAEDLLRKSYDLNPLDYRTYVGLAHTCLQSNQFNEAYEWLEKSIPHAPIGIIDYKSYSLRLIGRIYECAEDYESAKFKLRESVRFSPDYAEGLYALAQYSARTNDCDTALQSIERAIRIQPRMWYAAWQEENFAAFRIEVDKVLKRMFEHAQSTRRERCGEFAKLLRSAEENISAAWREHFRVGRADESYKDFIARKIHKFQETLGDLQAQLEKLYSPSDDYQKCLLNIVELEALCGKAESIVESCIHDIDEMQGKIRARALSRQKKFIALLVYLFICGIIGSSVNYSPDEGILSLVMGFVFGVVLGIVIPIGLVMALLVWGFLS